MRLSASRIRWSVWIICGVLLRLVFIAFPRPGDDDTGVYLELGHNLLHHGVYGMAHGSLITPSLFRLPGYPLILALTEQLFSGIWPHGWINVVFLFQAAADLAGAFLLAAFARRFISARAAEVAFALAALCPFTAVYAGIAMTECLSVFAISLGIYAAGRAIGAAKEGSHGVRNSWPLVLAGCAAALAMLLRPDGVLLFAAIGAGLFGYLALASRKTHQGLRSAIVSTSIYCAVALLPLVPWTIRNWTVFHVFQPLAPRYVNDPGERVNRGFYRWMRTWSTEYSTTDSVFWSVGSESIALSDLPARACDSPQQTDETRQLLDDYNRWNAISPELDHDLPRWPASASARTRCATTWCCPCCALAIWLFARAPSPFIWTSPGGCGACTTARRSPQSRLPSSILAILRWQRGDSCAAASRWPGCWAATSYCAACCSAQWKTPSHATRWNAFRY